MADIQFEHIDPWIDGQGDTGLTSRQKLRRNFEKIKAWMDSLSASLSSSFLRKDRDDETNFFITFLKGVFFGRYSAGALGTGGAVTIDDNGNSSAEFDYLTIRKAATFRSITILELKHIGGELGITAGAMKVSRVEEQDTFYRCFFDLTDGKRRVYQEFIVGDQARCQAFRLQPDGEGQLRTKYYWRLVVGVSTGDDAEEGYVDLSKSDCDSGSSVPEADDEVIQLGYRGTDHPERQSAIILSAVATDAPSQKFYQGIDSYNLVDHFVKDEGYDPTTGLFHCNIYGNFFVGDKGSAPANFVKYDAVRQLLEISGIVRMKAGSAMPDGTSIEAAVDKSALEMAINTLRIGLQQTNADVDAVSVQVVNLGTHQGEQDAQIEGNRTDINGLQTDVQNLTTGNENLLRNSGFTGDYIDEGVTAGTQVDAGTEMYSQALAHWQATSAEVVVSSVSASGKAVVLTNGSLSQTLEEPLTVGETYVFSFRGKGTMLTVSVGGYSQTISLSSAVTRYNVKFKATNAGQTFMISNATCTLMELQLIHGIVPNTDWINSPKDNDKTLAYYQNLTYLANVIANGNTEVLGGLILSQMLRVGNYRNGQMTAETGGMSGVHVDENSPFLWGGGDMEKAFYTIAKYAENALYEATDAEVREQMAQFVVTHGGRAILNDIIARGVVIATAGIFKNIMSPNKNFLIDEAGDMSCQNATVKGNMYAPFFHVTKENFSEVTEFDGAINYRLNLNLTGLNVEIDYSPEKELQIRLPSDAQFNGAIARIYNRTSDTIYLTAVNRPSLVAEGTYSAYEINDGWFYLNPYMSIVLQYQEISEAITRISDTVIEHAQTDVKLEGVILSQGDKIIVAGGITEGGNKTDGYYHVYGGTSSAPNTNLIVLPPSYLGSQVEYTVPANCTSLWANVAANSKARIRVWRRRAVESYSWIKVAEGNEANAYTMPDDVVFPHGKYGICVGHDPYIDSSGTLKFTHWERTDTDNNGKIHVDE